MNTKTHIERHVAGVDNFEAPIATYWAACRRWPKAKVSGRERGSFHKSWGDC
jgi:hypothetical protein